MVIDTFSKYVWLVAMKNKQAVSVVKALKKIFNRTTRRPIRVQGDKGREFINNWLQSFFKKHDIIFNSPKNEVKCSIAERVIRTLKSRIFKYLYYKNSYRYIDALQSICNSYNNSYHKTIRMAPSAVNASNVLEVYQNIRNKREFIPNKRPKCKVNDYVRISKHKDVFDKGYVPCWSEEIFKVKAVIHSSPLVYKIIDLLDEEIDGSFYEQEVQKVIYDEQAVFAIEKIVGQRRVGNSRQVLVKWRGWPDKFNSWVAESTIQQI